MSLACGGRGPCCHIGYAHRHCEHCDVVIPTHYYYHQPLWNWPYYGGVGIYYGNSGGLTSQLQQLQQYGASTIVEAVSHTHQEAQ